MGIAKTETGLKVLKDRSVPLSPRQRSAFILFDGKKSLSEVLAATAAMGVTRDDINHLIELGLLAEAAPATAPAFRPAAAVDGVENVAPLAEVRTAAADDQRTPQQRYQDAYPVATRLTAALGLRGFRLNLAIEAASSYEDLRQLAPKIRDAVGADRFAELDRALNG